MSQLSLGRRATRSADGGSPSARPFGIADPFLYSIYFASAIVFTLFFLPQALATNIQTILVCRFIS